MRFASKATVAVMVVAATVICSAVIAWRFHIDLRAASARAEIGARLVQTPCGSIEYQDLGQGPPVLMVHGSGGGHDQGMSFAAPLLRQGLRVVAMSRFGYLGTPLPAEASPAAQADAHACLLDALNIPSAAVVGASAGALSALQLTIRHGSRVRALILVVPITFKPAAIASARSAWIDRLIGSFLSSDFMYWSAIQLARDEVIGRLLATPPGLFARTTNVERTRVNALVQNVLPVSARAAGLRNEARVISELRPYALDAIRVPTLIISARDDGYESAANARYSADRIAGARLIEFTDGGHLLVGRYDEALSAIGAFVTQEIGHSSCSGHVPATAEDDSKPSPGRAR